MADTAVTIVDEIIADLSARPGLGSEWDQINKYIRDEIRTEWLDIVSSAVKVRDFKVAKAERGRVDRLFSLAATTWQTIVAANGGIPVDESTDSVAREIVRHCRLLISEVDQPTQPAKRRRVPVVADDLEIDQPDEHAEHTEHLEYGE